MSPRETLVLRRGRIYRIDRPGVASALAIVNGRIAAVGSELEVTSAVGGDLAAIDLRGRTVLPGFIDAHVHWGDYALGRRQLMIDEHASLGDVLRQVSEAASRGRKSGWLSGRGWDHSRWERWPTAADLDSVVSDRPVVLVRKDGHALWANSLALQAAGVTTDTPDPPGGWIDRQEGEPSGVVRENAMRLVLNALPPPTPVERQAAMADAWPEAWSRGITSCHDMGLTEGSSLFRDLATLRDAGELGLRFVWYLPRGQLEEAIALGLRSALGDEWLRCGGLKLYLDGSLGSQTAELLEPYEGRPGYCGLPTMEFEEYCEVVCRAAGAGMAVAVHAIGDAACRKALDGLAELARNDPRGAQLRHRIEHLQLIGPTDQARLGDLGVVASMQPLHATADMALATQHWGSRVRDAYPWRSLLDHHVTLAFGSDAPVEPPNVLAGVHAAVTRQRANHEPRDGWQPHQRISAVEAIAAYTSGAAWAGGQEWFAGSLAPGRCADLIVLDRDPFHVAPRDLMRTTVLATMIEGVWVWQAPGVDLAGPRHDA